MDSFFSATSVKTLWHDFVCGSAYINDGKFGIQFARTVSKAHIRAKTFTDLHTRFCVGFSQDPHTAAFIYLKRHPKCFEVEIKKIPQNIAVYRLKSASLDATWLGMDTSRTPPPPPNVIKETVIRSGRHVRWSKHLLSKTYYCWVNFFFQVWTLNSTLVQKFTFLPFRKIFFSLEVIKLCICILSHPYTCLIFWWLFTINISLALHPWQ